MPSKVALSREYDLLAVAANLEEVAGAFVGGLVCVERRGRPWRIEALIEVTPTSVTTGGGYIYDLATGQPQFETGSFCLRPLTREKLDYLILAEGLRVADKLKPNELKLAERAELMPAARALLDLYTRMRDRERQPVHGSG
ncbi:hypothetical protein [Deinococcus sp. QL22]|uniref:hypothetical protein n=1 Tax=Deinococcus sp. QL22 TaxID=2939437 RepID=UPI0020176377|nr:hypothetical protein [Deinococcus sp. QL22]UQN08756.1 hypothetical protein M1R55_21815 [Deinococcus sp. QL22]